MSKPGPKSINTISKEISICMDGLSHFVFKTQKDSLFKVFDIWQFFYILKDYF